MAQSQFANDRASTAHPSSIPYLTGLDGLRALAVIAVLLYHAGYAILGGYLGVESFFVLSGFLITTLLVAEHQAEGRIGMRRFWLRRARRLLPALFLTLGGTLLLTALLSPDELPSLWTDSLAALLYVMNWKLIVAQQSYFDALSRPSLIQHLWSLAIEEQFYLLWPLACVVGIRLLRLGGFLAAILIAALGSSLLMIGMYEAGVDAARIYYGTDTRASALLIGAALALFWTPDRRHVPNRLRDLVLDGLGTLALIGMLAAYVALNEQHPRLYLGGFQFVTLATAFVIAAAIAPGARLLPTLLELGPLRWIGKRSYSLYLWHWPIFLLIPPVVTATQPRWSVDLLRIGLTVLLAAASYRFIEQPIRIHGFRGSWKLLRSTPPQAILRSVITAAFPVPAIAAMLILMFGVLPIAIQSQPATASLANPGESQSAPVGRSDDAAATSAQQWRQVVPEPQAGIAELASATPASRVASLTGVDPAPTQPSPLPPTAGATATPLPPTATPLPALDAALIADLQALLDTVVSDGFIPGAVLTVSVPGYAPWSGASGLAEREPERAMTPDTPVRIASVSKMFTAVVVLQLVAEGRIALDQPIATYLPDRVPGGARITVRQLLQHTAGLYDYLEDRRLIGEMQRDPTYQWAPQDLVDYAAGFPLRANGRWDYSSTHYVVLGMLVEEVTGDTLDRQIRRRIFEPLAMDQAAFLPAEPVPSRLAHGYSYQEDITMSSMSFAFATANLAMTTGDLERFGRALFSGELLQPKTRDLMLGRFVSGRGQYGMPDLEYGLGVMRNRLPIEPAPNGVRRSANANLVLGHIGGYGGFRSALWYAPESGIVVTAGFNQAQADPNDLAAATLDRVLAGIGR